MRHDSLGIFLAVAGLILILVVNIFPLPSVEPSSLSENNYQRNVDEYTVLDVNSTFYKFTTAEYSKCQTQNDVPSRPKGWFELTIKIPFEIYENWTKIHLVIFFSTGTYGGVKYYWTLRWKLFNDSYIAFSDELSRLFEVSANSPAHKSFVITNNFSRSQENNPIRTLGQWFYEATLTVHNVTLKSPANEYINRYSLSLEVLQETSKPKQAIDIKALYSSVIAVVTIVLILGIYMVKKLGKTKAVNSKPYTTSGAVLFLK